MPPFWVIRSVILFLSELRIFGEMDFVNFIFEFSEFYESIILVIKKLSAGIYEIWARRENAGISAFKLLLPEPAPLTSARLPTVPPAGVCYPREFRRPESACS